MKVYSEDWEELEDYVGRWFMHQHQPQDVHLEIPNQGEATIDYNPDVGNGVPERVWHNRTLRLNLPSKVYSEDEANQILDDLEDDISALQDDYFEKWNGQNTVGYWNDDLVEALQVKLQGYTSKYGWADNNEG